MKTKKRTMLELPEVKYLTDKIPIARFAIKGSAVHLRYFQYAKEAGIPFKAQMGVLGIPWVLRKIDADLTRRQFEGLVWVAELVPAPVASGIINANTPRLPAWLDAVNNSYANEIEDAASRAWYLRHILTFGEEAGLVRWYLKETGVGSASAKPANVLEKGRKKHANRPQRTANRWLIDNYGFPLAELMARQEQEMLTYRALRDMQNHALSGLVVDDLPINHYPEELVQAYSPDGVNSIHLLTRRESFNDEGAALNHCLGLPSSRYWEKAKGQRCHIASVRNEHGARLATVEYGPDWSIAQIKGHSNRRVERDVELLARSFASHAKEVIDRSQTAAKVKDVAPRKASGGGVFDSSMWTGGGSA